MGKWTGVNVDNREVVPYENSMIFGKDNVGLSVISDYNNSSNSMLQVLTHPSNRWS